MEQNVRTLGVIFATLALIASVLVMPNVSATDGDIQTSIAGDNGLTSYALHLAMPHLRHQYPVLLEMDTRM